MSDTAIYAVLITWGAVVLIGLMGLFAAGWVAGYGVGFHRGRRPARRTTPPSAGRHAGEATDE